MDTGCLKHDLSKLKAEDELLHDVLIITILNAVPD